MTRTLYGLHVVPNGEGVVRVIRKATGSLLATFSVRRDHSQPWIGWEAGPGYGIVIEDGADGLIVEGPVESYEPIWRTE